MKDTTLFNTERQTKILDLIRREGSVSVNYLSQLFHVSTATIRYDLTKLESSGEISRTHGGAILNSPSRREPLINERFNDDKKQLIAEKAVGLVHEHDILLIDTGTTMVSLAKALVRTPLNHLIIFTNDIDVIRILEEKEGFELHLFAGKMRNGFHYCYGPQMIEELRQCHFGKLFLASSAVSLSQGLTTANPDLAMVKEEMIRASEQVILLADSTKLGQVDFQRFAALEDMNTLIMDSGVSTEDAVALENAVPHIIFV